MAGEESNRQVLGGGDPLRRGALGMLLFLSLVVWLPFALLMLSLAISSATGCAVNEAFAQPCLVAGVDLGGTLATMMTMGWLAIVLSPFMLLSAAAWLVLGAAALFRRRRAA